jgi:hypothetical protein
MIAALFATALALSNGAVPSAPSTATPQPAGPLREVVYKYSYDKYTSRQYEDFGIPPSVDQRLSGYSGTMTVDVTAVGADGSIKLNVTESSANAQNLKKPLVADIIVHPDGGLLISGGNYDDVMETLAPYFGTSYFGDRTFQEGETWEQDSSDNNVPYVTNFTIKKMDGDTATVYSVTKPKQGKVSGTFTIEITVVYKASLLVPLSLDMVIMSTGSLTDSTASAHTRYSFQRVSDTKDSGASGK